MRATFLFCALALVGTGAAAADDAWHYAVTPYLWLPTINGNLNYEVPAGDGRFDVEIGPNDYLTNLNFAALVTGEARRQRYSIASDLLYFNVSNAGSTVTSVDLIGNRHPVDSTINVNTDASLKAMLWSAAGGYSLTANPDSNLDAIVGVRYLGLDTAADWKLTTTITTPGGDHTFPSSGHAAKRVSLWDPFIGLRGRAALSERWHVPYYVDAGAGSSKLTWQAMTGISYAYAWGDVGLIYRHLAYEQKSGGVLKDFKLSGPGVTFRFHF